MCSLLLAFSGSARMFHTIKQIGYGVVNIDKKEPKMFFRYKKEKPLSLTYSNYPLLPKHISLLLTSLSSSVVQKDQSFLIKQEITIKHL